MPRRDYHRWTRLELDELHQLWQEGSVRRMLQRFAPRSWESIRHKAESEGLTSGVPQGFETLNHAARRLGMDHEALVRMLTERGVTLRRVHPDGKAKLHGQRQHRRCAERSAIDDAFEAWSHAESLGEAARRLGLAPAALWARLQRRGLLGEGHGRRVPARRLPEVYDAAMRPLTASAP